MLCTACRRGPVGQRSCRPRSRACKRVNTHYCRVKASDAHLGRAPICAETAAICSLDGVLLSPALVGHGATVIETARCNCPRLLCAGGGRGRGRGKSRGRRRRRRGGRLGDARDQRALELARGIEGDSPALVLAPHQQLPPSLGHDECLVRAQRSHCVAALSLVFLAVAAALQQTVQIFDSALVCFDSLKNTRVGAGMGLKSSPFGRQYRGQ